MDQSVAGVLNCDYKLDGVEQLICCSVDGEVKGFKAMTDAAMKLATYRDTNQESIRDMTTRKQNLILELKNLEEAAKP